MSQHPHTDYCQSILFSIFQSSHTSLNRLVACTCTGSSIESWLPQGIVGWKLSPDLTVGFRLPKVIQGFQHLKLHFLATSFVVVGTLATHWPKSHNIMGAQK